MTTLVKPTPSNNFVRGFVEGQHRGMDYGWQQSRVEESMKILSAAPGRCLDIYEGSNYNQGWGRRIRIDHGHGAVTTYNHMRPGGVLIRPGQDVAANAHIGLMGSSGEAKGTHLHFELYLNGVRVDPYPYFSKHLPGTGLPPAPAGDTGQVFFVPPQGQVYYWQYENALNGNADLRQVLRANQILSVVDNPGTGPVRVRAADGDLVWVGTRRNPAQVVGGTPAAPPAPVNRKLYLPTNWYWYRNPTDAANMQNVQGKKQGQIMLRGEYPVLNIAPNGSVEVLSNSMGRVWLHSSARQHLI